MTYYDAYLVPVRKNDKEEYLRHVTAVHKILKEHGAERIVELWGDDVPDGKLTSFRLAVKLEEEECVVMGYITWPSKMIRDAGWEKIEQDERMHDSPMPYDGKRLIYGGFQKLFDQ